MGFHLLVVISIFGLMVGSSRGYTPIKPVDEHTRNGWAINEWYPITSHMKTSNIIVSDRPYMETNPKTQCGILRILMFLSIKVSGALLYFSF